MRLWHWESILFNTRLYLIHLHVVCCYFKYLICVGPEVKVLALTPSLSVADPDPGSGMGKKIRIRIRDEQSGSYFRELRISFWLKYRT
jgi:hypothetical protein